ELSYGRANANNIRPRERQVGLGNDDRMIATDETAGIGGQREGITRQGDGAGGFRADLRNLCGGGDIADDSVGLNDDIDIAVDPAALVGDEVGSGVGDGGGRDRSRGPRREGLKKVDAGYVDDARRDAGRNVHVYAAGDVTLIHR